MGTRGGPTVLVTTKSGSGQFYGSLFEFLRSTSLDSHSCVYDTGRAHCNSLQIKAETKSPRHRIYALIGYTYSRAYDTVFSDGLGSITSVIYQLPFGKGQ